MVKLSKIGVPGAFSAFVVQGGDTLLAFDCRSVSIFSLECF